MDTLGLLLRALVQPADIQDRDGGLDLLVGMDREFPRLKLLSVDSAYAGEFEDWVQFHLGWQVERTLAWLGCNRRLAKDYEELAECGEAHLYLASISLLLKRLVPCTV